MDLFYGKPEGNKILLSEEESNHLLKSKRHSLGEIVFVTDGEGNLFSAIIESIDKRTCTLAIQETRRDKKKLPHLHIAISPTKSIDRIEWFLEKVTEFGIDEITFLNCRHSERKEIKQDRLQRVVIAALKQSVKTFLPRLNPMTDFNKFITGSFMGSKLICSTGAQKEDSLKNLYSKGESLTAVIGPEGDFHSDEINSAVDNGFSLASLGESRLRTETAGIAVCSVFHFMNEDLQVI